MKNIAVALMVAALALTSSMTLHAADFTAANPKDIALYPQQNAYRNRLDLSGIWNFQLDPEGVGETEGWQNGLPNPASIAVPGSWNDQLDQQHNYLGCSWYEHDLCAYRMARQRHRTACRFGCVYGQGLDQRTACGYA